MSWHKKSKVNKLLHECKLNFVEARSFSSKFLRFISIIIIYTVSDLGDLSNLIGSLSQTIQQYSPPSEWIMCELSVFPFFLETIF